VDLDIVFNRVEKCLGVYSQTKIPFLCLGDEDTDDVHNDDDDFWPDEIYGGSVSSEDEFRGETEIEGSHFGAIPVMR
jgi:hypothetical protein